MAKKAKEELKPTGVGKIQAKISDFKNGLRTYDNVQLIRIKSRNCSLLIMEDYFPTIGSVHGNVDVVMEDDIVHLTNIDGFYLHRNNEFSLLISEEIEESQEKSNKENKEEGVQDVESDY